MKTKINYVRCKNDSTITKTKQSDIVSPIYDAIISGETKITLNDVMSESSASPLIYNSSLSDYDILFSESYNLIGLKLKQTKRCLLESIHNFSYNVLNKIFKIQIKIQFYNTSLSVQNPPLCNENPFVKMTILNTFGEETKQKISVQSISNNSHKSQSTVFNVPLVFIEGFTQTTSEIILSYCAPLRINGDYYSCKPTYVSENGLLKLGEIPTNTLSSSGAWSMTNTFSSNYSQTPYASNVYYYTSQVITWFSPFYPNTTQPEFIILVNSSGFVIAYSYELIVNCKSYAITTPVDLRLRTQYFINQVNTTYTLEECFFSDEVNAAMTAQTGITFTPLTQIDIPEPRKSIITLSKCLKKLLTFNISNTNALRLKIITSSQDVVNSDVTVSDGKYTYCGFGNLIFDRHRITAETTNGGQVIANSLSTITVKDDMTYSTFIMLPETQTDDWDVDCEVSSFLLSGNKSSVFYRITNSNNYLRITDNNEYIPVNTCYE